MTLSLRTRSRFTRRKARAESAGATESVEGVRRVLARGRRGVWSTSLTLGLRCDLETLPPIPEAQVPITMERVDPGTFDGFAAEAESAVGSDRSEARLRARMCSSGLERLYVASVDGRPAYAQWLISGKDQDALHSFFPRLYPRLADDEALLEGAYTFTEFRGKRAMAAGMSQLLFIAKDEGLRSVITFVDAHYPPSMKGCARSGFEADAIRIDRRRLGLRRPLFRPLNSVALAIWQAATMR